MAGWCPPFLFRLTAAAVAVGCAPALPSLELSGVEPSSAWNGAPAPVTILGSGFYPDVSFDARTDGGRIDRTYGVELHRDGERFATLQGVLLRDLDRITGTVPKDLPPGAYDVVVHSPRGVQATLAGGFTVRSTQAEQLSLTPVDPAAFWIVDDVATFDAAAFDSQGRPLREPLPVRISVASIDGRQIVAGFPDGVLLDQVSERTASGASIVGRLRLDGTARVPLSVATPSTVQLKLQALEPGVQPATAQMSWYESADYELTVELPHDAFSTTAGQGFVARVAVRDRAGRVVDEPVYPVSARLADACGELSIHLPALRGVTEVPIYLRGATGPGGCASEQVLTAFQGATSFTSAPFTIHAGPMSRFHVALPGSEWEAGTAVVATVRGVDLFGNTTRFLGDPAGLRVRDTAGDIDMVGCLDDRDHIACHVRPTLAERGVVLIVRDPVLEFIGTSMPYAVRAGPLARLGIDVEHEGHPVEAGAAVGVSVGLFDAWGNPYDGAPYELGEFLINDRDHGVTECVGGSAERARLRFGCRTFRAHVATVLHVAGPRGAAGESSPFDVINGSLARVSVSLSASEIVAGESVIVALRGEDHWGNPYRVQRDPVLTLADPSGTLGATHARLDHLGEAVVPTTITRAGVSFITASRDGSPLGASSALTVRPAPADALELDLPRPWVWVDRPVEIGLRAIDRYHNDALVDLTADLTSAAGVFEPVPVEIVRGRAAVTVTPLRDAVSDSWTAVAGDLLGESAELLVARDCGSGGPSAPLTLDGGPSVIACDSGGDVSVAASLAGAAGSPDRFGFWVKGGSGTLDSSSSVDLRFKGVGAYEVIGLAVQGTCATEGAARVWIAPDDGTPAGPIPLALDATSLRIGQDTAELVVDAATDCAGAPAAGGRVFLRTDRGALTAVTASGGGLVVELDETGSASAGLDLTRALGGGAGVVSAWAAHPAAAGAVAFDAIGDKLHPRVISQTPEGYASGSIPSVRVTFTEPIDPGSLDLQAFKFFGPSVASVAFVEQPLPHVLDVFPSSPIAADSGRWTLQIGDQVADLAGNGLDGAGDGTASTYDADFGAVSSSAPTGATCSTDRATFRPDGDEGAGIEADRSRISLSGSGVGSWRIEVVDPQGLAVRHARVEASSSGAASFDFDGRDNTERVLPDGTYSVVARPRNDDGTGGATCVVSVSIDNRRGR